MSYLALARKWRPRTFSQLVGQEHISKALINSLTNQRLHHAYLFTGTRGVGKTSIARLLAKALNCEQGISAEPCLQCDTCLAIEQGRFIDLIEVDAASRTGVEDTRAMLENVQYSTTSGRFKIYLIDEVHMLSQHSFNALLKTLEEPPAHVKFFLATTDEQKIPVTVLSRCLQFHLRHLPEDRIEQHLQFVLTQEQVEFDSQACNLIARAARGSMRDALSLLDQALATAEKKLGVEDVKSMLGYTHQDYALQILQALADNQAQRLLTLSESIAQEGGHFRYVLETLLEHIHHISIQQVLTTAGSQEGQPLQALAQTLSPEDCQLFYQIGLKGLEEIHWAPSLNLGFNMILLRMLTFKPSAFHQRPVIQMSQEQQQPKPAALVKQETAAPRPEPTAAPEPIKAKPEINADALSWPEMVAKLQLTGLARTAIENAEFIKREGKLLLLKIAKGHQSLFTPVTTDKINLALEQLYQTPVKLQLQIDEATQASPAQEKQRHQQAKQSQAEEALEQDQVLQHIKDNFAAQVVKSSIKSVEDVLE